MNAKSCTIEITNETSESLLHSRLDKGEPMAIVNNAVRLSRATRDHYAMQTTSEGLLGRRVPVSPAPRREEGPREEEQWSSSR